MREIFMFLSRYQIAIFLICLSLWVSGCYSTGLAGGALPDGDVADAAVDTPVDGISDGFESVPDFIPDQPVVPDLGGEVSDDLRIDPVSEIVMVDASATCNPGDGWYSAYISGYMARGTALHMMAVYEAGSLDVFLGPTCHPVVLVLTAYETTTWNFHLAEVVAIERILVYSYDPQIITGAEGVPVEEYGYMGESPYRWDSAAARAIAADAESRTGLILTSFQGCYTADEFFLLHVCE